MTTELLARLKDRSLAHRYVNVPPKGEREDSHIRQARNFQLTIYREPRALMRKFVAGQV